MSIESARRLRLVVLSLRNGPQSAVNPWLEAAFTLWTLGIHETYKSLGRSKATFSDQFTRQDLLAGIFAGDQCVGLVCFRRTDTSRSLHRADSWFQNWPDDLLVELGRQHRQGLVMSFLTVHPDWRRGSAAAGGGDSPVSALIVQIASLVFLETGAELGYGMTRNNRGVNKLAQSAGWTPVRQGVRHFGYDSDLIVLHRDKAREAIARYDSETLRLWTDRTEDRDCRLFSNCAPVRAVLDRCLHQASAVVTAAPWQDAAFYTRWLGQTYSFVRHSTRLLAAAAGRMHPDRDTLFRRFTAHLAEEQGHEKLAAQDLEAMGHSASKISEWPLTVAFYETQFSKIDRLAPSVLLGYILFLEGLAAKVGPEVYTLALRCHGTEATRFLRVHAEEDPDHLDKAFRLLEALPAEELDAIAGNIRESCDLYCRLINAMVVETAASDEHS